MSRVDETYRKIVETLENKIKDENELNIAKKHLDEVVKDIINSYDSVFDLYEKKISALENLNKQYEKKIDDLDKRLKSIEKIIEMEDYDIFIECPYCGFEFQTDYDEDIEAIPCPECGKLIEVDWSDDEDEDDDNNDDENNEN